jgi:pyridinium-3,5-bisthiocarboxylic acid mononucleotide nickel chelatase
MTLCYLDAFSGLSGDMLVGAMADAGADTRALTDAISSLGTGATFEFEKVKRHGLAGTQFHVRWEPQIAHRHLGAVVRIIEAGELPERAKRRAIQVFQKLSEAEALAHDVSIEKVHFHEVGAVDSISDIVGACVGLELLGVEQLYCSPVNVGSGTVETEHGTLPVPAPATARLLTGKPVYARGPAVELTTPTGAAVAAALATAFGAMPPMTIAATGYGAGTKDFAEHANLLRITIGTATQVSESTTVDVIEANIDDLSPQVLGYALERLMAAGALDVSLQPLEMKKGRPGTLLRVVTQPELRETLAALIFRETSTLGLRIYTAERRVQTRHFVEVDTPHGKIRVKVGGDGGFAPEFEDCRRVAIETGAALKQVLAEANFAYLNTTR